MKAKIDLDKFVCSLMKRYYETINIDPTTTKCWLDDVLEDQGLEYKDDEIVELPQENENESIRIRLINGFKECLEDSQYPKNAQKYWHNIKIEDILAWIEKQDEKNPVYKIDPKFKVGEFVINSYGFIMKVVDIKEESYRYIVIGDNEEKILNCTFRKMEESCHLWDISDAKDGDVLVYGDNPADHHLRIIMLFKSMRTFNSVRNHFHIFADEFRINDWCDCGKTAHPATKEQRDLLFKKMREAGYEWNEEKKELKKIEKQAPKTKWSDDDEQYLLVCKNALRKYQVSNKWDAEIISKWLEDKLKQREPKSKWTEEDDYNVQCCIAKAKKDITNGYPGRNGELIEWLESLKQRWRNEL